MLALLLACAVAPVAAIAQVSGNRETRVVSPPPPRPPADAASDNATFSQDHRNARLMAFDSAARNLVGGDTNARRDVFVLRRSGLGGSLSRASVNSRGRQANGDSVRPSLDGDARHLRPHCVAFESRATNLARGDRSRDWDVFVRNLRRRTTRLASPRRRHAREAVIDGECEFVTYAAGGFVWVRDLRRGRTRRVARGADPDQQTNGKGVAYERGRHIYYRRFQRVRGVLRLRGREVLASRGAAGPGNGASRNPSMDDSGYYVAFESDATNLCLWLCKGVSEDGNGAVTDVFRRTLSRRAPTRDRMQMASYSYSVGAQGNGPSNDPEISSGGEFVLFDSAASNLRPSYGIRDIDPNGGMRDVYLWNFPRARGYGNVSRESRPEAKGAFFGPSYNAATSSRGNYIGFTSEEAGQSGEANGPQIPDVFIRFLGNQ